MNETQVEKVREAVIELEAMKAQAIARTTKWQRARLIFWVVVVVLAIAGALSGRI